MKICDNLSLSHQSLSRWRTFSFTSTKGSCVNNCNAFLRSVNYYGHCSGTFQSTLGTFITTFCLGNFPNFFNMWRYYGRFGGVTNQAGDRERYNLWLKCWKGTLYIWFQAFMFLRNETLCFEILLFVFNNPTIWNLTLNALNYNLLNGSKRFTFRIFSLGFLSKLMHSECSFCSHLRFHNMFRSYHANAQSGLACMRVGRLH